MTKNSFIQVQKDDKLSAKPQMPLLPTFIQSDVTFSTHEREMGLYLTLVSRVDPSHSDDAFKQLGTTTTFAML